jgi:hypothetical protein
VGSFRLIDDVKSMPGGLFTPDHWMFIAYDLLRALTKNTTGDTWADHVKPQTKAWGIEYLLFVEQQKKIVKERALAKLTHDDKVALGLEG